MDVVIETPSDIYQIIITSSISVLFSVKSKYFLTMFEEPDGS